MAVDCGCDEDAGAIGLLANEKPVKELVVPEEVAGMAVPKPVKELVVEAAELAGAEVKAVVIAAEEELTLKLGNATVEAAGAVVVLAAGAEALVVVTVENNGAVDIPNDNEVGFVAVEVVALLKLNERLEELALDEDVSDGIVVDAVVDVKLWVAFGNENPVDTEKGEAELELEDELKLENEGPLDAEPNKLEEPVAAPNRPGTELAVDEAEPIRDSVVVAADEAGPNGDGVVLTADAGAPNTFDVVLAADEGAPNTFDVVLAANEGAPNTFDAVLAADEGAPNTFDVVAANEGAPNKGDAVLAADEAVPKEGEAALDAVNDAPNCDVVVLDAELAADEDTENGDGVVVIVLADKFVPNGEGLAPDLELPVDEAAPKADEADPNRDGELLGTVVDENEPNPKLGGAAAGAELGFAVDAKGDEEEEKEEVLKENEVGEGEEVVVEEAEVGFAKGRGEDPNENPVDEAEDPNGNCDDVEDWEENEEPDIAVCEILLPSPPSSRSHWLCSKTTALCWGFEFEGFGGGPEPPVGIGIQSVYFGIGFVSVGGSLIN